jgi:hypothetical protein
MLESIQGDYETLFKNILIFNVVVVVLYVKPTFFTTYYVPRGCYLDVLRLVNFWTGPNCCCFLWEQLMYLFPPDISETFFSLSACTSYQTGLSKQAVLITY